MTKGILSAFLILAGIAVFAVNEPAPKATARTADSHDPTTWEGVVQRFEAKDRRRSPEPGSVVFVGSSSLRLWKTLGEDLAPTPVINRGFGGSRTDDVLHYVDRIVTPYRPRAVVYYAGDNDLGRDAAPTPATVADNFKRFVERVREGGAGVPVYFISIKPSPKRMGRWPSMAQANRLVESFAAAQDDVTYLDVASGMLDAEGNVRHELFSADGVHMNAEGYALWTSVVRPVIHSQVGPNPLYL